MGVEGAGAGAGASRSYRVRVSRNESNRFYASDGWDQPISQSNRHLLLHPTQVMIENPYYARMMAEMQAEETYFRQLRAAAAGRSIYEDSFARGTAPPVPVAVDHEIILQNLLVERARDPASQFGAVGQAVPNANRPRAIDLEAASVSSEEEEDENLEEESEDVETETMHMHEDQELLDAIESVKIEMMANNAELKSLQKKTNEPAPEKKVDATEEIPSTFRWVHIEIV